MCSLTLSLQALAQLISALPLLYPQKDFYITVILAKVCSILHAQILYLVFIDFLGGEGGYCVYIQLGNKALQDEARSLLTWAPLFRHNNYIRYVVRLILICNNILFLHILFLCRISSQDKDEPYCGNF